MIAPLSRPAFDPWHRDPVLMANDRFRASPAICAQKARNLTCEMPFSVQGFRSPSGAPLRCCLWLDRVPRPGWVSEAAFSLSACQFPFDFSRLDPAPMGCDSSYPVQTIHAEGTEKLAGRFGRGLGVR